MVRLVVRLTKFLRLGWQSQLILIIGLFSFLVLFLTVVTPPFWWWSIQSMGHCQSVRAG